MKKLYLVLLMKLDEEIKLMNEAEKEYDRVWDSLEFGDDIDACTKGVTVKFKSHKRAVEVLKSILDEISDDYMEG